MGSSELTLSEIAHLREALLPARAAAAVIEVLRAFERKLAREIAGFSLPESLSGERTPDLRVILSGGRRLYFSLGLKGKKPRVFGGIDIKGFRSSKAVALEDAEDLDSLVAGTNARFELNVSEVARQL